MNEKLEIVLLLDTSKQQPSSAQGGKVYEISGLFGNCWANDVKQIIES